MREGQNEFASRAQSTIDSDSAMMQGNDLVDDRQAEPRFIV